MNPSLEAIITPPDDFEHLDIPQAVAIDIVVRYLFNTGDMTGHQIEQELRLPFKVLDGLLGQLQHEHIIEVKKGVAGGIGRRSYLYSLTQSGKERARDAYERSQYVGPAPIPVEKYNAAILAQYQVERVNEKQVKEALSHLILPDNFHRRVGPAVNAGSSLFLYGPPGNGKTTISQAIAKLVGGRSPIWLPYSITIGGQIIQLFDELIHKPVQDSKTSAKIDPRWSEYKRPFVLVGGELTMRVWIYGLTQLPKYMKPPYK